MTYMLGRRNGILFRWPVFAEQWLRKRRWHKFFSSFTILDSAPNLESRFLKFFVLFCVSVELQVLED